MKHFFLILFAAFSSVSISCAADDKGDSSTGTGVVADDSLVAKALDKNPPLANEVRRDAEFFFFIQIDNYLRCVRGLGLEYPSEEAGKALNKYIKIMKRDPRIEVIAYCRYNRVGSILDDAIVYYTGYTLDDYHICKINAPFYIFTLCKDGVKFNNFLLNPEGGFHGDTLEKGIITVLNREGVIIGCGGESVLKYWKDYTIKPIAVDKQKRKDELFEKKRIRAANRRSR